MTDVAGGCPRRMAITVGPASVERWRQERESDQGETQFSDQVPLAACSLSASRRNRGIVMVLATCHTHPFQSWLRVPCLLRDARWAS